MGISVHLILKCVVAQWKKKKILKGGKKNPHITDTKLQIMAYKMVQ